MSLLLLGWLVTHTRSGVIRISSRQLKITRWQKAYSWHLGSVFEGCKNNGSPEHLPQKHVQEVPAGLASVEGGGRLGRQPAELGQKPLS